MQSMIDMVKGLLEAMSIKFEQIDDVAIRTGYAGRHVMHDTLILVEEEPRRIHVNSMCPATIPQHRLPAAMELAVRLNSKLPVGHFDILLDDGQMILKTSIMIGERDLDQEIFEHLFLANWAMMDACFPMITAVLSGALAPKEAIELQRRNAGSESSGEASPANLSPRRTARPRFGGRLGQIPGMSSN